MQVIAQTGNGKLSQSFSNVPARLSGHSNTPSTILEEAIDSESAKDILRSISA